MRSRFLVTAGAIVTSATLVVGQTRITPPSNKYTPDQDVQLGRQAAAEVRQQLPIMKDDAVTSYIEDIGRRLVAAIPPELQHSEFRYTFEAVNVREINAFALPGGPMFVNRGMLEAAHTEGEVAGVMAHEISHVALRHGTAQASKATKYEIGSILGAIGGAIIGGNLGQIIGQGVQFGVGTAFLRFSREFEKQADIEGSHIMAAAGYDPRDMANMFKTIEKQSGGGGPEWLSDHPNPGNRSEYIVKEAELLHVSNPVTNTQAFERLQAHLRTLPKAPTTEEATRNTNRRGPTPTGTSGSRPTGRVAPPSTQYRNYDEGNIFRVSVPSNWRELPNNETVTFAPDGGYGDYNGQSTFTHGIEFGVARNESHDLQTATEELVNDLARGNPRLSRPSGFRRTSLDGRNALQTTLDNVSEVTGRSEQIQLVTTQMRDGNLFYSIAVVPDDEASAYRSTFNKVVSSVDLRD
ncbi:MAG TPA: M48 family metallopeptidase [Vicinamibacterales bacterium]|jgi:Zn-dependent protease with chaperone function